MGQEVDSNAIEVHIHHLRRKIGGTLIQTVRGVGYMLQSEVFRREARADAGRGAPEPSSRPASRAGRFGLATYPCSSSLSLYPADCSWCGSKTVP